MRRKYADLTVIEARKVDGHPEREKYLAYQRAQAKRTRERGVERARKWREENLERRHEIEAAYRARNLHRSRWHKAKRRAECGPDERDYIAVLQGDPCSYCGVPSGSTDHIVPVAEGGEGTWGNLTAACRRCNSRKGARSLLAFLHGIR